MHRSKLRKVDNHDKRNNYKTNYAIFKGIGRIKRKRSK